MPSLTAPDTDLPTIEIDAGLPGFPEHRRFVLVRIDEAGLLFSLRSLDDESLRFLVVPVRRRRGRADPHAPPTAPISPPPRRLSPMSRVTDELGESRRAADTTDLIAAASWTRRSSR